MMDLMTWLTAAWTVKITAILVGMGALIVFVVRVLHPIARKDIMMASVAECMLSMKKYFDAAAAKSDMHETRIGEMREHYARLQASHEAVREDVAGLRDDVQRVEGCVSQALAGIAGVTGRVDEVLRLYRNGTGK